MVEGALTWGQKALGCLYQKQMETCTEPLDVCSRISGHGDGDLDVRANGKLMAIESIIGMTSQKSENTRLR